MAKRRFKHVTAKLRLVERADGLVQIEIVTARPLAPFRRGRWVWDNERRELA
jgi:hypothetical protein